MNYINEVEELIMAIEESAGQVNEFHKQTLHNSKQNILDIVDHLQKQILELQSELGVRSSIQREGY